MSVAGKCNKQWHPSQPWWGVCTYLEEGHDGPHQGNGYKWTEPTEASDEDVKKFIACYRRIPNSGHEIVLNKDGTVTMTMRAFDSSVRFINVMDRGD